MAKALVLLSGGLDSMLAAKVLMEQGIEVTGLVFKSYFFNSEKAKKVAERLGIELIEVDFSQEHLAMVKNPKHGYGKNMNPCIDCHALMLKRAGEYLTPLAPLLKGGKYNFVATGEVLGERPMSQNPEALKLVEKIAGLKGRLIRPLSAKLLDETEPEKAGLVNREKLLDISGRSRKPQLALVKKYGIKEYQRPGGGCVLTDPAFSQSLLKMFENWPKCDGADIELLKHGRVVWLKNKADKFVLIIVGRERMDNENLEKLAKSGDILINLVEDAGPTGVIRIKNCQLRITKEIQNVDVPLKLDISELRLDQGKGDEEILEITMRLTGYYATKARGKIIKLKITKQV